MRVLINIKKNPVILYEIDNISIKIGKNMILDRKGIIDYLDQAFYLAILLEGTHCIFCEQRIDHYDTYFTDGDWVWSSDINHYVKEHGVNLPQEFLEHIRDSTYSGREFNELECNFIFSKIYDHNHYLNIKKMEVLKWVPPSRSERQ